jgi:hypothetical protein
VDSTRLIFTTRTQLPAPFDRQHLSIDRLDQAEAIELVGKVLGEGNRVPRAASDVENEEQIEARVEAVNCHARSLVLVARELMDRNLPQTTATLRQISRSPRPPPERPGAFSLRQRRTLPAPPADATARQTAAARGVSRRGFGIRYRLCAGVRR